MSLPAPRRWLGLSLFLLVVAIVVLCVCVWQSTQLRAQKSLTTDFALTLTRLAQWHADIDSSLQPQTYTADSAARLVAAGDVLAGDIQRVIETDATDALLVNGPELLGRWQQIRSVYSDLNVTAYSAQLSESHRINSLEGLSALSETYTPLFNAIGRESLSLPLLSIAGDIRGELLGLEILVSEGVYTDATGQLVDRVKEQSQALEAIIRPVDSPSILGYQSSLKLDRYLEAVAQLNFVRNVDEQQPETVVVTNDTNFSEVIADGLAFTRSVLASIESEVEASRRNVYFALLLCSLCLVFTAVTARSVHRHTMAKADSKRDFAEALQADLLRFANGEFNHQSTVSRDTPSGAAVASAYNSAVKMVGEQQSLSKNMLAQSSALAMQQQEVIESLEARLASLSENGAAQSADLQAMVLELQSTMAGFTATGSEDTTGLQNLLSDSVADVAASLARITAQLEVSGGRIDRAIARVKGLQPVLSGIEKSSQESSLQALNESIKQSGYHSADSDSERFVERAQRVSHQLQMSADKAVEATSEIQMDLSACADALKESLVAAQEGAHHALHSTRIIKTGGEQALPDLSTLQNLLQELTTSLQQADITNRVSLPEEELLFLKGHALELQLLAAEFTRSTATESAHLEVQADER